MDDTMPDFIDIREGWKPEFGRVLLPVPDSMTIVNFTPDVFTRGSGWLEMGNGIIYRYDGWHEELTQVYPPIGVACA